MSFLTAINISSKLLIMLNIPNEPGRAGPAPGHAHACDQTCKSCLTMFEMVQYSEKAPTTAFPLFIHHLCPNRDIFLVLSAKIFKSLIGGDIPYRTSSNMAHMCGCDSLAWAWVPGPRRLLNKRLGRRADDRNNQES